MKIHSMVARKDGKMRIGKGFSKSELKEAGVDFKQALRLTVPVDLRRRTRHEENVNALRQQLGLRAPKTSKKTPKSSQKPSKPVKTEVAETKKPSKPTKLTKQKKVTKEISKPSKRAKAPKTEKPAPKKSATKRKTVKPKGAEKT